MRKKVKVLMVAMCLSAFGLMALGSTSSDSGEGKEIVGGSSESKKELVTIENQVVLDNAGIKVTAEEYVDDSIWGEGIKLLVENNSDKDVTVSCKALIVNNYMITDLFVADVASGKKSNETMYLSSSALKAAGIDTVGEVEIYFHVYETASLNTIFDSECVTIKTSAFENMDTTPDDAGTELYNANGIRIVGKTVDEDSFWGSAILLYCENTTDKNVGISVEDMSINGFMMNPLFSETVYSGKMAIGDITLFSSDLEENGIETIQDVELKFHIYDADTYGTIADSDVVKFTAQ